MKNQNNNPTSEKVRKVLWETITDMRERKITVYECMAVSNAASKITGTVLAELKHREFTGTTSDPFPYFDKD